MKKFAKLSLIAAIAVVGTTASAQPLAEAIKNVDVSGTVAYRYDDREDNAITAGDSASNSYKVALSASSKVTDDVTFNSRFIAGNGTGPVSLGTSTNADANVDVELSEANFTYTGVKGLAVTVGKQGVATPFTVHRDAMGAESTGTGILATYTFAPVTFAGAYFNQTNIVGATDIYTVGVMASFAGVNAEAWYIDADDTLDAYTVAVNANFNVGAVSLSPAVRYTDQDNDANNDKVSTFKASLGATVGMFDAYLAYADTGKDGGVAIDGLSSATVADDHWRVGLLTQADSDVLFANVGAQVTDKLHVSLRHSKLDRPNGVADEKETYGQVVYQHSSNLLTYVRFGEFKRDGQEAATSGRLHVQYSF